MDTASQDVTQGTVGWFAFASGTVGLTKGQTFRLSVVNVGAIDSVILCGIWQNPRPMPLMQDSYRLASREGRDCDVKASELPRQAFDKSGRNQIRGFVRSSSRAVCVNLEVFDSETGRTTVAVPLQEVAQRA